METASALEKLSRFVAAGTAYRGAVVGSQYGVRSDMPTFGTTVGATPGGATASRVPARDASGQEMNFGGAPATMQPPVSPEEAQIARRKSIRLRRAQNVLARITGGLGCELESAIEEERRTGQLSAATRTEIEEHGAWLEELNPELTLSELYECVMLDRYTHGHGLYAVRRSGDGVPAELYPLPARATRVMLAQSDDGLPKGYVRFYGDAHGAAKFECYKRLGVDGVMSRKSGKIEPAVSVDDIALEAVQRKTYDPESEWYGVPALAAARETVDTGYVNWLRLINWLWRSPGWIAAAIARGMDKASFDKVTTQVEQQSVGLYGVGKLLNLNSPRPDFGQRTETAAIQVQPFGSGLPETEQLLAIDERADQKVSEGYGIFDIFMGSSKELSRAGTGIARQIFYELEAEPVLQREEAHFTRAILRRRGAKRVRLRFRRPSITDAYQNSQIVSRLNAHRVLPANDVIRMINQTVPGAAFAMLPAPFGTTPVFLLQMFASALTQVAVKTQADGGEPISMTDLFAQAGDTFAAVMRATRESPRALAEAGIASPGVGAGVGGAAT